MFHQAASDSLLTSRVNVASGQPTPKPLLRRHRLLSQSFNTQKKKLRGSLDRSSQTSLCGTVNLVNVCTYVRIPGKGRSRRLELKPFLREMTPFVCPQGPLKRHMLQLYVYRSLPLSCDGFVFILRRSCVRRQGSLAETHNIPRQTAGGEVLHESPAPGRNMCGNRGGRLLVACRPKLLENIFTQYFRESPLRKVSCRS